METEKMLVGTRVLVPMFIRKVEATTTYNKGRNVLVRHANNDDVHGFWVHFNDVVEIPDPEWYEGDIVLFAGKPRIRNEDGDWVSSLGNVQCTDREVTAHPSEYMVIVKRGRIV